MRAVRSDRILHEFIRRQGIAQEELAQAKSRLAQVDHSSHSGEELETFRDHLRETKVELRITRDRCDGAPMSVAKMAGELNEERRDCEVASRSTEIFRTEVADLH